MHVRSAAIATILCTPALALPAARSEDVDGVYPAAHALYSELHQNPELSGHETQTAARLTTRLRGLGYNVTEHVGGTGLVAILKNGTGPTVMLRTELDALPVEEKTGLPYASKVHAKDDSGQFVFVGHMCGHDLHMAALMGTAAIMAGQRNLWHGTLMLIGQPAEEPGDGAKKMIDDGLLTRFPKPDVGVALHVLNLYPAGKIAVVSGFETSNEDDLRITLYGKGGHGSYPNTTVDPVVMASKLVLSLQTIVSRETKPGTVAVMTVGYVHAGTANNVIPDQAVLGLTVRSYDPEVRKQLLASIERIAKAEADSAGAPRAPNIEHLTADAAVYNEPRLAERLRGVLESALGQDNVVTGEQIMPSDDYSEFIAQGIPSFYFWLGGADPQKFAEAKASGQSLPSNHSPYFAPDIDPALHTAIAAETAVLRFLLNSPVESLRSFNH